LITDCGVLKEELQSILKVIPKGEVP